jgi:ribosome-binding factor A
MSSKRLERIAAQMIRDLSDMLQRKLSDPRLSWVTVTRVSVTPDLREAKIFVTSIHGTEKKEEILAGLHHAKGFIRHELGDRLQLRITPDLRFYWDDELEKAERVVTILQSLKRQDQGGAAHGGTDAGT